MQIKVLSLNIWDGGRLFDELITFLKEEEADIYLFQEVFAGADSPEVRYRAFSEIQKQLSIPYAVFAPAYIEVSENGRFMQGNAVMSRFPLQQVSVNFYDVPFRDVTPSYRPGFPFIPRNLQHVTADIAGKKLHLLNTQGIWGEEGGDNPRRVEMGKTVVREIEKIGAEPVVVAGDFNTDPNTVSIRQIEEKLPYLFKDELQTSFNVQQKDLEKYPGYAKAVVDLMFASPTLNVVSHHCPQVNVSDHLPLVGVFDM